LRLERDAVYVFLCQFSGVIQWWRRSNNATFVEMALVDADPDGVAGQLGDGDFISSHIKSEI
jgi:hypothetical protein